MGRMKNKGRSPLLFCMYVKKEEGVALVVEGRRKGTATGREKREGVSMGLGQNYGRPIYLIH